MGMASGERDMYFGTDVGKWGAGKCLACGRGKFYRRVYTPNAFFCGEFKCG